MAELARRLDMAVTTVARWARCGRIPSSRTINGEIQFRPEDVAAVSVTPEA
jgi:predicted site-specific integrase-resolvase